MRRSPLLDRAGAVPNAVGDPDELVPAHYGDPLREQRLLESAAAVTVLARDVVAVTGADRLSWLTTLSSQVLTDLTPGDGGLETLVLDAKGRIVHALAALDDAETLWLVTEAGRGPALVEFLERMRFMLRVAFMFISPARVIGKAASHLQTRGTGRLSSTGAGRQPAYDQRRKGTDHTNEVAEVARARPRWLAGQRNSPSGTRGRTPWLADCVRRSDLKP